MNIWCISKYACPPKYGAAARIFNLAKEFNRNGNNAIVITSDSNHLAKFPATVNRYNTETIEGVVVHWIKTKKYLNTASVSRMLSWLDFELGLFRLNRKALQKPDIIIISSLSILSIFYGYYLKKHYKAFLVFEIRDIWPLTMTEEGGFNHFHPLVILIGWVEKFGYKVSDLIVGTMPKLDLHVEKITGKKRPFFCSPLGYEKKQSNIASPSTDDSLGSYFPKDKIIIGYAGSMGILNALDPFIQCIEELKDETTIHFVLVGSGDFRDKYEEQLSNAKNVTFAPRIPSNRVPDFLSYCDILYLSTHKSKVWDYGQSMNKVVEYMMAGKPIIASYSGYPSMINEAQSGSFIPANNYNALKTELLKFASMSQHERESIGKKGRNWILKNRSYTTLAKEYLKTLRQLSSH